VAGVHLPHQHAIPRRINHQYAVAATHRPKDAMSESRADVAEAVRSGHWQGLGQGWEWVGGGEHWHLPYTSAEHRLRRQALDVLESRTGGPRRPVPKCPSERLRRRRLREGGVDANGFIQVVARRRLIIIFQ